MAVVSVHNFLLVVVQIARRIVGNYITLKKEGDLKLNFSHDSLLLLEKPHYMFPH